MRWLIQYIRQCFCKHEFKELEGQKFRVEYVCAAKAYERKTIVLYCTKCGYNKWFWGE